MALLEGCAGVDVGATLCKLVYAGEQVELERLPSTDRAAIHAWLAHRQPRRLGLTGGGARGLLDLLGDFAPLHRAEFEAWARGAPFVAEQAGGELPEPAIVVSLGTGTSILALCEAGTRRLGGCALGGGTIVGLGRLLCDNADFVQLSHLASSGDRSRIDLLVGDIYPQGGIALPAEINAASFGKLESRRPQDLMAAVMGLVGENVALLATALARGVGAEEIVYCGSAVEGNPSLVHALSTATEVLGCRSLYLRRGAYCGAFGAALLASAS